MASRGLLVVPKFAITTENELLLPKPLKIMHFNKITISPKESRKRIKMLRTELNYIILMNCWIFFASTHNFVAFVALKITLMESAVEQWRISSSSKIQHNLGVLLLYVLLCPIFPKYYYNYLQWAHTASVSKRCRLLFTWYDGTKYI